MVGRRPDDRQTCHKRPGWLQPAVAPHYPGALEFHPPQFVVAGEKRLELLDG
jgi:hypothetical protein